MSKNLLVKTNAAFSPRARQEKKLGDEEKTRASGFLQYLQTPSTDMYCHQDSGHAPNTRGRGTKTART